MEMNSREPNYVSMIVLEDHPKRHDLHFRGIGENIAPFET
jgi:hypothetical protein